LKITKGLLLGHYIQSHLHLGITAFVQELHLKETLDIAKNPRDIMLPAVACSVCEIFAFKL